MYRILMIFCLMFSLSGCGYNQMQQNQENVFKRVKSDNGLNMCIETDDRRAS